MRSPYVTEDLRDDRIGSQAVRTLEIGELDQFNGSARGAPCLAVGRGDLLAGWFEGDPHRPLGSELLHVRLIGDRRALLGQQRPDRLADLLELRPLHPRRVRVEPRDDLRVTHGGDLRGDLGIDQRGGRRATRLRLVGDQLFAHDLVHGRAACLVQRQHELHLTEICGRLLHRLLIDLGQRDGHVADRRDDVGWPLHSVGLLGTRGTRHQK